MNLIGASGETWELDEDLREKAIKLQEEYPEKLEHIDLQKVIFVRVIGARKSDKWLGKCWYIRPPLSIIPRALLARMYQQGLLNIKNVENVDDELLDIFYIIGINETAIAEEVIEGDLDDVEYVTLLHEMLHIKLDMNGLEEHDTKDFAWILNEFGVSWTKGIIENKNDSKLFEEST